MTRYKSKQEFEAALRTAPIAKFIDIRNDAGTGNKDLPTVPYELVREIADIMYSEIIIVKNQCSIEPSMGLLMVEMEILATPSYPDAEQKKLFGNCTQRLINQEGKILEPYMIQRKAESTAFRDAFKTQGNIFGRNLRGKHGADFTLQAKEVVDPKTPETQPNEEPPKEQNTANSPV